MGAHSETQYYKSFVDCLQPIENNPKIQRMKNTNANIRYKQIQTNERNTNTKANTKYNKQNTVKKDSVWDALRIFLMKQKQFWVVICITNFQMTHILTGKDRSFK